MNKIMKLRLRASLLLGIALTGVTALTVGIINSGLVSAQNPLSPASESESDRLEQKLFNSNLEERRLLESKGDAHPDVKTIRQQIAAIKQQISAVRKAEEARQVQGERARVAPVELERVQVAQSGPLLPATNGPYTLAVEPIIETIRGVPETRPAPPSPAFGFAPKIATQYYETPGQYTVERTYSVAEQTAANRELAEAYDVLRKADADGQDKAAAREKLVEILGKQFETDLEQRTKQIEQLEKQIATLKEQIEKRRTAKDRLIELRIELMLNEGEGLGFPNAWQQPLRNFGPSFSLPPGPYYAPVAPLHVPQTTPIPQTSPARR